VNFIDLHSSHVILEFISSRFFSIASCSSYKTATSFPDSLYQVNWYYGRYSTNWIVIGS